MTIDHIGVVVRSIESGIDQWEQLFGYQKMTEIVINSKQNVKVIFLRKDHSPIVKLIQPFNDSSPVYNFARKGGGLHHLCFKCNDMTKELDRLQSKGLRMLSKPEPGEAFENENIAFVYANNGLNIELIDTDKKAKLIG